MPALLLMGSTPGRLVFAVASLLLLGVLAACSTTAGVNPNHFYEYQQGNRFVRLEPIESAAPGNNHPYQIPAEQLQVQLSALQVTGISIRKSIAVFTEDEAGALAARLASALSKAGAAQDISFQSAGRRGTFGEHSPASFTTGRVFVQDGKLQIIFGSMHSLSEPDRLILDDEFFPLGSRSKRVESGWHIEAGDKHLVKAERGDWISFSKITAQPLATPASEEPALAPMPAKAPPGTADDDVNRRLQALESRLLVLEELKRKKLITEQEYSDKRRAILDEL